MTVAPETCVFCAIANGGAASHLVLDEPEVVGFLDRTPVFHGHVLVVPRQHHETLPDLPPPLLHAVFAAAQRVSRAVPIALGAEGTFVAVNNRVSQSVAHLHVHVVPRTKGDGLKGFFWPRHRYAGDEQMAEVAAAIRSALVGDR